jgi:elongator complex protein 1
VSQTLYKDTLNISKAEAEAAAQGKDSTSQSIQGSVSKDNKINWICDAFLAALKNKLDTNLQNLVTAHVCKSPPDLDAGLRLVAGLRGEF